MLKPKLMLSTLLIPNLKEKLYIFILIAWHLTKLSFITAGHWSNVGRVNYWTVRRLWTFSGVLRCLFGPNSPWPKEGRDGGNRPTFTGHAAVPEGGVSQHSGLWKHMPRVCLIPVGGVVASGHSVLLSFSWTRNVCLLCVTSHAAPQPFLGTLPAP